MNYICPVCNGLVVLEEYCPNCREIIMEKSNITENLEPYAPYELQHTEYVSGTAPYSVNTKDGNNPKKRTNNDCIHQVVCPNCEVIWNIFVNKVTL